MEHCDNASAVIVDSLSPKFIMLITILSQNSNTCNIIYARGLKPSHP